MTSAGFPPTLDLTYKSAIVEHVSLCTDCLRKTHHALRDSLRAIGSRERSVISLIMIGIGTLLGLLLAMPPDLRYRWRFYGSSGDWHPGNPNDVIFALWGFGGLVIAAVGVYLLLNTLRSRWRLVELARAERKWVASGRPPARWTNWLFLAVVESRLQQMVGSEEQTRVVARTPELIDASAIILRCSFALPLWPDAPLWERAKAQELFREYSVLKQVLVPRDTT